MTIGLSREVAGEGIRDNGVRPGSIYTDMHASGGEPGEVAQAVLCLLSDEAAYTTGSFIDVSGGRQAGVA